MNLESAKSFLYMAASGDVQDAFGKYVSDTFKHHNVYFKGDRESLLDAMAENTRANPDKKIEFINCVEQNDLVAVHSKIEFPSRKMTVSVAHFFRFKDGKIVEMWDVGQQLPEELANENGAF